LKIVTLERFAYAPDGTFGSIKVGYKSWYTVERPWQNNLVYVSCIPCGVYEIKLDDFKGRYPNYRLVNVDGRTSIEIHRANQANELQGCIALGKDLGAWKVLRSTDALTEFMVEMEDVEPAILHIYNKAAGYI